MAMASTGTAYGGRRKAEQQQQQHHTSWPCMPARGRAMARRDVRPSVVLWRRRQTDDRTSPKSAHHRRPSFETDNLANISTIQLYRISLKVGFGRGRYHGAACFNIHNHNTFHTPEPHTTYYHHHEDRIPSHPNRLSRCLRSLYFTNGMLTTTSPRRCNGRCGKVSS